ncbi:Ube3c [Symbiodinium pilosum]|uniref:Ube3c protein n=1 Tax=Symbiodinium pilosum TaxID=2952 RepID=A0A812RC00_SYMPI|nr:Ube3c [Symbiodinium pilosum]
MAGLWNALRSEVMGTVDEFRQKGAIGALRDAALDARDMATDAGSWVLGNVKSLVDGDGNATAVLRYDGVPPRGAEVPLQFSDGRIMKAIVLQVDGVSSPPRAQVQVDGMEEAVLVPVLPTTDVAPDATEAAAGDGTDPGLLASIRQEFRETVQDFKQKGAVGALKDAAFDAVDMVGSTAGKAVNLVGSTAGKAVDGAISLIDVDPKPEQTGDQAAPQQRGSVMQLVDGVKSEIHSTVQDFREKGAVATFKDAALDAVDLVGTTATTVVSGAKGVAAPLLEDFWASDKPSTEPAPASVPAASSPSDPSTSTASAASAAPTAPTAPTPASASAPSSVPVTSAPAPSTAPVPAGGSGGYAAAKAPEATGSTDKPGRKSLVQMRRAAFEKQKEDEAEEPKQGEQKEEEEEEVID